MTAIFRVIDCSTGAGAVPTLGMTAIPVIDCDSGACGVPSLGMTPALIDGVSNLWFSARAVEKLTRVEDLSS